MATAAAVVGAVSSVAGAASQRSAQKKAAKTAGRASIESARVLEEAGRLGEQDIIDAQRAAAERSALGAQFAEQEISPFVDPGRRAFLAAEGDILKGRQLLTDRSSAAGDAIRQAALSGAQQTAFGPLSAPVAAETQRQAGLAVSGAKPAFRQALLAAGQQGIAAAADVGGIRQRGFERLADIAGATGAQRASVLTGATPQLLQLAGGAQEARLLGDVAGQQFRTSTAETLAGLAGRLT
jgi:hypothetical protein